MTDFKVGDEVRVIEVTSHLYDKHGYTGNFGKNDVAIIAKVHSSDAILGDEDQSDSNWIPLTALEHTLRTIEKTDFKLGDTVRVTASLEKMKYYGYSGNLTEGDLGVITHTSYSYVSLNNESTANCNITFSDIEHAEENTVEPKKIDLVVGTSVPIEEALAPTDDKGGKPYILHTWGGPVSVEHTAFTTDDKAEPDPTDLRVKEALDEAIDCLRASIAFNKTVIREIVEQQRIDKRALTVLVSLVKEYN